MSAAAALEAGTGRSATVRVPATSANLGPGFDSFGLALARYDEVSAVPDRRRAGGAGDRLRGRRGAAGPPSTWSSGRSRRRSRAVGEQLPGLRLTCVNRIPHGGGLGSSAAAIVAGLLLGRELVVADGGAAAVRRRACWRWAPTWKATPTTLPPPCSAASPWPSPTTRAGRWRSAATSTPTCGSSSSARHQASSTHHTRGLLPATVPHADAAANAAAAGLLVHALTVDPSYLLPATRDRLHQHYRAAAMPASARLVADLRAAGVAAVISGAGPSVIALVTARDRPAPVAPAGFRGG